MSDNKKNVEIAEESITESCEFMFPRIRILMLLTEIDRFDEHHKTGVWFEEFAIPYLKFLEAGFDVDVVTIHGKEVPIDPASENFIEDIKWHSAKDALKNPKILADINCDDYDAIVIPGGHGPLYDLADSEEVGDVLLNFYERSKLISAICHGPAALLSAKKNRIPLVKDYKITAFTNDEEISARRDKLVPFSVEDKLKEAGADFVKSAQGEVFVVEDRTIITGQNYQSAEAFADKIVDYLSK